MIFVAPHEIHALFVNGKLPYERMVLLFDMEILLVMMRKMGVTLGAFSYEKKNRFHIIEKALVEKYGLGALLLQIIKSPEDGYKKLDIISKLINFVIAIDKLISENTERFKKPDFCDNLVNRLTEYIDANIDKPLDLDGIAKALLVSKSTLCHKFTSVMSVPVNRYITMKKIYRGAELIRSGVSTHDAARLVGYDAYTSFFYNYKKIIGLPPSASTKDGRV